MSSAWFERNHWTMPIYSFMRQTKLGQAVGLYIYYVSLADLYIYVGQTYNGVRLRLWQHASRFSLLGEWLIKNEHVSPEPICGIIRVSDCLDMAERYYISLLDPQINVVRYKNSLTIPPIEQAQIKHIDIQCTPSFAVEYGAITGLKRQNQSCEVVERYSQERLVSGTPADLMADLYDRAYRDPNHPDLRNPS